MISKTVGIIVAIIILVIAILFGIFIYNINISAADSLKNLLENIPNAP